MRIYTAKPEILQKILERKKREEYSPEDIDLKAMLREILLWANRFVPSQSGSILLDDPTLNQRKQKKGLLYFVACFGKGSSSLVDNSLPVDVGIVGQTYATGKPYISKEVDEDSLFYSAVDEKTKFRTRSIICCPIKIKGSTIGVLELINREGRINYDKNDLTLLEIFAEYTSTLVQNSLDAKRFAELSIRDNLTGLFNDRHFYDTLTRIVTKALKDKSDLSLLFLDLDHFKEVNDNYGHLAGSRVLAELGAMLATMLAPTGAVAARYGGDEFVIIFPGFDIEETALIAEEIRGEIEQFVFLKKKGEGVEKAHKIKGVITASIGIASLKGHVKTRGQAKSHAKGVRDALIKQADKAMYASKENGRNMVTRASGKATP